MAKWAFILLLIWILEIFLVGAFVRESWFVQHIQHETDNSIRWLGADTVKAVYRAADNIFESTFVETGLYDTSYELFIPSAEERRRSKGMESMGKEIFTQVDRRLDVMWIAAYQVIVRVLMLLLWAPYFVIILVPAIVDGVVVREIKKVNFGFSSPMFHRYAIYAIVMVLYLMLLTLFSPVQVAPIVYPLAILIIVVAMNLMVANTHKRL